MNVPSYELFGFAALAAIAINLSKAPAWRRAVLLVANLAFLLSFTRNALQLAPFAGLLLFGFVAVKLMERHKRKASFTALMVAQILLFCILKRYEFLPASFFLPFAYLTVGMSYIFFKILHLVIDAFEGALPERISPVSYVNYTLNFTSLVSGPIPFYRDYRRTESERPAPLDAHAVARAVERIVLGFFKVAVISPLLYAVFQRSVALLPAMTAIEQRAGYACAILVAFLIYVYVNFSGYMDFVIGVARFLRLELPENFNRPFVSGGFIEFWSRWHITLANWIRTYVYSPLLLSLLRRSPSRRVEPWLGVFSYFVAFFVVGIWHGRTSTFIFLGVLLGLGVSLNKWYEIAMTQRLGRLGYRALCTHPIHLAFARGLTFAWFAISALWFWANWGELGRLAALLTPFGIAVTVFALWFGAVVALLAYTYVVERAGDAGTFTGSVVKSAYFRTAWSTALMVITVSVTVLLNAPAPHLVYKVF